MVEERAIGELGGATSIIEEEEVTSRRGRFSEGSAGRSRRSSGAEEVDDEDETDEAADVELPDATGNEKIREIERTSGSCRGAGGRVEDEEDDELDSEEAGNSASKTRGVAERGDDSIELAGTCAGEVTRPKSSSSVSLPLWRNGETRVPGGKSFVMERTRSYMKKKDDI